MVEEMGSSMNTSRIEVIPPRTFGEMPDSHQIKVLADDFPYRWGYGQRDSIESLGDALWYAREQQLYRKVGCVSWEDYCRKFYRAPAEAFDELIEGVRILQHKGFQGPISEAQARAARTQPEAAQEEAKSARPVAKNGAIGRGRVSFDKKNVKANRGGNSSAYRVGKIKRDHPKVADRLANGEFKSVSAAERAASGAADNIKRLERMRRDSSREVWIETVAWFHEHEEPYAQS